MDAEIAATQAATALYQVWHGEIKIIRLKDAPPGSRW